MTAGLSDGDATRLPLWRVITGFGVLAILITLLITAGLVYLDNFRLDRYMRDLAASSTLSDADLTGNLVDHANQLGLPVHPSDITITRTDGKAHIQIARYTVQTKLVKLDLRLPQATSR